MKNRPNYDAMTDAELKAEVEKKALTLIESLIEGGEAYGGPRGLGESLNNSVSMTYATELYWGSSGKGNPNAKARIRAVASLGYICVEKHGRNERVSLLLKGLDLYLAAKAAGTLPGTPTEPVQA